MIKKITWLFAIVAVLIAGLWLYQKNTVPLWQSREAETKNSAMLEELVNDQARLENLIKNSEVLVETFSTNSKTPSPSRSIKLKDGVGEFVIDSVIGLKGDVFLVSVLGKNKTEDGYDVFADLAFNSGGTGIFHNVAIFHLATTTATHISSASLGDRIKTLSATALVTGKNSYELTVKYLDRRDDEPMSADPTVAKEVKFQVIDHLIKS